jgi:ABC-type glycerol-3-phosphate transport system substrate-binding protein
MIPYAQWAKYEIQHNSGVTFDFDIAMMKTPKISATAQDYNYNVGFGDSMIIPANIPETSKALAKDFLRYLAGAEACKTFVDTARGAF